MAEKASLAKFHVIQRKLETAQNRMKKIKDVADDKVQHIVSATEVAGAAFAVSLAKGYMGDKGNVAGIPLELLVAGVLHGAGLFGVGGNMSSHLHAFGNGALAAAAAGFGKEVGMNWAGGMPLKDSFTKSIGPGDSTRVPGQRLSDAELAALQAGV